ncbi:MAG TPA: TolC family protein [Cytophagaceae bacterium]|jgi:outer membrane protein|nr:TolC family protein [Cytophagaceae bacterium]
MKHILKKLLHTNRRYVFALLVISLYTTAAKSQDLLLLEDVIKIAIENNFDISIAKNNIQVAKNNNNIGLVGGGQSTGGTVSGGSTGMLPQISVAAGSPNSPLGVGQTVSTLKYSNPAANITDQRLTSTSYAPSIIGTWYFFDGLKMFATKKKLNRNEELSNLNYRLTVENTLLTALTAYYQMISIQQYIKSLRLSLALGEDQKKLADEKHKAGAGSNVEVLQTQIDYNNIQVQIIQQQNLLNEQRINLNNVLKRSPDMQFNVPDTIQVLTKPEYENALGNTDLFNNSIRINRKTIEIDELGLKEYKGNMYPKIGITGNWTYQRVANDVGFSRLNQNYGYNAGLIFSWTILNNLTTNTAIKNQKMLIDSDRIRLEASKLLEKANLYKAYLNFQNNLTIIDIEKKSVELANQNLTIASQRFKQGISNYIEYRTVQQSYEDSQYRLSQAAYNAKLSELNYLKAQGLLVH